jgi:iron complex transport system substrate-binding protein
MKSGIRAVELTVSQEHDVMSFTSRAVSRRAVSAGLAAGALGLTLPPARGTFAQSTPESGTKAGETRIIQHTMGESAVSANPQRIVVLDGPMLDAALAVGITPVGAVTAFADAPFPAYLGDKTNGIANVGQIQEPDLEKIVALKPDLILGTQFRHEAIYDQLSQIAPTVFSGIVGVSWKEDFLVYTDAMNKGAEGQAIIAAYDARVDEFKTATEADRANWRVSVVRFLADQTRIYFKTSFIGIVLEDLDLPRPEAQDKGEPEERFTEISRERIREVDGTVIFACAYGEPSESQLAEYMSDPLWQTLDAVKNGKVYWVDDDYWMVGIGYIAANLVIDDLFAYLVEGAPATPVPAV